MSALDRTGREAHDSHCEADTCHCGYTYAQHEGYGCGCPGALDLLRASMLHAEECWQRPGVRHG